MFTTCLGGSHFSFLPPRGGATGRAKKKPSRGSATGKQSSSTSGSKGNVRSSGTSAKPAGDATNNYNWFMEQWEKYTNSMGDTVNTIQKKTSKFEVPVKVDVDWVKPTLASMQEMSMEAWMSTSPDVRRVAPFVLVSLLTGLIVQKINNRTISEERYKNDQLNAQIVELQKKNKTLEKTIKGFRDDPYSAPHFANQLKMATAVSQATSAAAQAAEAAATAAQACGLRIRKAATPKP